MGVAYDAVFVTDFCEGNLLPPPMVFGRGAKYSSRLFPHPITAIDAQAKVWYIQCRSC